MKLIIKSQKFDIKVANTTLKRLIGLMGKRNFNYGVLFKKCNSIHTFFMKKNIDIIAINDNNMVIAKYQNIKKNKIIIIKSPIKKTSVIELPANTSNYISIGETLSFESE